MHPGSLPVLALRPEATWKHGGLGAGALDELPCMTSWKLGRCAKAEVSTAKFKSRPLQNFWQPQYRLEHYSPLPSVNQVLRNTPPDSKPHTTFPRKASRSALDALAPQASLGLQPPDSWSPPLCSTCVSLCSPGDPLVPRSSRRRPRPRPRRRTTRSQAPGPIPSPFRCKSAAMATLGDDLLGTVNKLQDLVFNTIGNDSLDLPQIVRGHVPRCATLPGHGMLTIPLLC